MVSKCLVRFLPSDRVTRVPVGTALFAAANWIGLPIDSTCGGRGTCGKCKVQVFEGRFDVNPADHRLLRAAEIEDGWRLSCQAQIQEDTRCLVPQLMRMPKAATMGVGRLVLLDPNVRKVHLVLEGPDLDDQRSDLERVHDGLAVDGYQVRADLEVLQSLPLTLRQSDFEVTAVVAGDELLAVEPGDSTEQAFGIAFDVGTTTIVGTLMSLVSGRAVGVGSKLNAQASHGADVISRISHAMAGPEQLEELRSQVLGNLNDIINELCQVNQISSERIYEAVVVGNATMLHLLLGINPQALSVTPFSPVFRQALDLPARSVGLQIHPNGRLQTLPCLGAYVGADIVAGTLACGLAQEERLRLFVDVGTNGEIVLGSSGRVLATAAPAGPAFEGSQIRCGMRATDGAIEGVVLGDTVELQVIGTDSPRGICGSGLVDIVAQLRLVGLLDRSGRLKKPDEAVGHRLAARLIEVEGSRAFSLADGVYLTQRDIRELQFAKGSIATGTEILMRILGITAADLDQVLLGGSFGTYLNPQSARIIGLVPPLALSRIASVGNTAGEGAKMALLSFRERQVAGDLPSRVEYVELSGRTDFNDAFIEQLAFPDLEGLR